MRAPAPSPSYAPPGGGTPYPPAAAGPVLDTTVDGRHVRADAQTISHQGQAIALAHVEWVRYWVKTTSMRGPFGVGRMGIGGEWHFEVGRYPMKGAEPA